jgi:hypothetical protein
MKIEIKKMGRDGAELTATINNVVDPLSADCGWRWHCGRVSASDGGHYSGLLVTPKKGYKSLARLCQTLRKGSWTITAHDLPIVAARVLFQSMPPRGGRLT